MAPGIDLAHVVPEAKVAKAPPLSKIQAELQDRLNNAIVNYENKTPNSKKLYDEALLSLPGGNTRTLLFTSPWPCYIKHGHGYQVTDEDGHTYACSVLVQDRTLQFD